MLHVDSDFIHDDDDDRGEEIDKQLLNQPNIDEECEVEYKVRR